MSSLAHDLSSLAAVGVEVTEESVIADLSDGRTIAVPLEWYPRLIAASREERNNWRLIGDGEGIRWPDVDEDISIAHLIAGNKSTESQSSLQKWLSTRSGEAKSK
ncbi:MAG: DUF2442 domain-containing protein [Treponema sp.]|nr:DUF2442 domain-containing protein [Treponema sp.]